MKRVLQTIVGIVVVSHAFALTAYSFQSGITIKGKIVDGGDNRAVPAASIQVIDAGRGAASGPDGSYQILNVPKGTLIVEARHPLYLPLKKTVTADFNKTMSVNFELQKRGDASVGPPSLEKNLDTTYYVAVENFPQPVGGIQEIQKRVVYPEIVRRAGIEGTVYVAAFIDENGDVSRTSIVKGVHPALDKAAVKAIQGTKFTPGTQKGKPVKVQVSIPIRFRINVKQESMKHTLYPGNYPMSTGAIEIPEQARWGAVNTKSHSDKVLLKLESPDGYMSVMSYLSANEARKLADELRSAAAGVQDLKIDPVQFAATEQVPEPIGGIRAMMEKLVYPESAKNDSIEGTVYVVAYIDENGNVAGTIVEKGVRKDLNEAAEKAVRETKFKPVAVGGKKVKTRMTIPIRFKLSRNP